jgi:acyl-CoA thioesterase-1
LNRIAFCTIFSAMLLVFAGCGPRTRNEPETDNSNTIAPETTMKDARPAIVTFGDSLTEGAGVSPSTNYPAKLQERLDREGYRYRVVNEGVSGETSAQGLNRTGSIISLKPEIVVVEFGANDGLRGIPVETMTRNIEEIVRRLQSAGIKVILAGMEVPPNYGPPYARSFREAFKNIAESSGVPLIPFFLDGVGGHPELNQEDGIHPTAEGYDLVVENVWKTLQPLLQSGGD